LFEFEWCGATVRETAARAAVVLDLPVVQLDDAIGHVVVAIVVADHQQRLAPLP
jgi:hypothetical protein